MWGQPNLLDFLEWDRNWLGFSVGVGSNVVFVWGIEIDLVFVRGVEVYFVFMFGPKMARVNLWIEIYLV